MLVKVKDHSSLCRDDTTGAIVSVSNGEWYKAKQRMVGEQISKDREAALRNIEYELAELKSLIEKMREPRMPWYKTIFYRIFK